MMSSILFKVSHMSTILALQNGSTVEVVNPNSYVLDGLIVVVGAGLVLLAICRSSLRR
jgi:hypothetical protein